MTVASPSRDNVPANRHGLFVTLEGGEGAGKSLQCDAVRERLCSEGYAVSVTREPGGTPLGERLRAILLDLSSEKLHIDPFSEALLFLAARAELVTTVIRPALERGDVVICDRFADSTRAYQGFGRGVDVELIDNLNSAATGGLEPHLTVLLDLPPEQGLSRRPAAGNDDRFGREDFAFHERVRGGYQTLARGNPDRWLVIDGSLSPEAITDAICQRIARELTAREGRN
jgi:dTMP kinase